MIGIYIANLLYNVPENGIPGTTNITPIPDGQVLTVSQQVKNEQLADKLGTRNRNGVFNIPTDKEIVWLPFLGIKTVISDPELERVRSSKFSYFIQPEETIPEFVFSVGEGDFYRCADGTPKPIEQYQYYIIQSGVPISIPNYKTLEVLLYERGKTLLDVKVVEKAECMALQQVINQGGVDGTNTGGVPAPIADKTSEWKEEYQDFTSFEKFQQLVGVQEQALAVAATATQAVQQQIDAANALANATQASANAANAAAAASSAQAQAAQAQAAAAIAEANAAAAASEQATADAQALQAELTLQLANQP